MIAIQQVSGTVFLFLSLGLPVCAFGLGWFGKPRLLVATFGGQLAVMFVDLSTLYRLLETERYPNTTGMEGIAFAVMPTIYVASIVVSTVVYFVAAWVSRRRRLNSGH